LVKEDDLAGALPWFVEALRRVEGDVERERMHRLRLEPPLAHRVHPSLPYAAALVWAAADELDRARQTLALAIQRERWWRDHPTDPVPWLHLTAWALQRAEVEALLAQSTGTRHSR
jgi:hypothetical protein